MLEPMCKRKAHRFNIKNTIMKKGLLLGVLIGALLALGVVLFVTEDVVFEDSEVDGTAAEEVVIEQIGDSIAIVEVAEAAEE
jgi:hypothetical protein